MPSFLAFSLALPLARVDPSLNSEAFPGDRSFRTSSATASPNMIGLDFCSPPVPLAVPQKREKAGRALATRESATLGSLLRKYLLRDGPPTPLIVQEAEKVRFFLNRQ